GKGPFSLIDVDGTLFFEVNPNGLQELWKSDGTEAGTVSLMPVDSTTIYISGSFDAQLTNVNGTLFFIAKDDAHGAELWKSDGTTAGTLMVADIIPGSAGSINGHLTNVGGTLFFGATDGIHGVELWKSDGTAAGTVMVKDINPGGNTFLTSLTN